MQLITTDCQMGICCLGCDRPIGCASQDKCQCATTLQGHFFAALRHCRLIPADVDINSLQYSRCGRTDKGVSALSQVVALMLRSRGRAGEDELPPEKEMDYPGIINRSLPDEIRVMGWTTAPDDFSARSDVVTA